MSELQITEAVAKNVLTTVDVGLVDGIGEPEPGKMCVEAAVCFALGLPHDDDPPCVSRALIQLKIRLNDSNWSSSKVRAAGLRRLAIAQLGTDQEFDDSEFSNRVVKLVIRKYLPISLRALAKISKDHEIELEKAALKCESEQSKEVAIEARDLARKIRRTAADAAYAAAAYAAYAAYAAHAADAADAAAYAAAAAASYAARDRLLSEFAEDVVQILIEMSANGVQWLYLTEKEVAA